MSALLKVTSCTISLLLACSLAFPSIAQKEEPGTELANVVQQASKRWQEYVDLFKDLTSVETKTTELIDKNGKVDKQRKVISDFLVYASPIKSSIVNEYRITREVDGKAVGKDGKQAIELFEKLAKAKTLEQEGKRLREENLKHTLRYYRWGITLQSPLQLVKFSGFTFEIVGREKLDGRETILLKYRQNDLLPGGPSGLLRNFKDHRSGSRGRAWLDAETFRIWRWVSESTVIDRDIPEEVVYMRDEVEYEPSAFGPNIPRRIVTTFYDKADQRTVRLSARITYTYQEFKRFDVTADYEIQK